MAGLIRGCKWHLGLSGVGEEDAAHSFLLTGLGRGCGKSGVLFAARARGPTTWCR